MSQILLPGLITATPNIINNVTSTPSTSTLNAAGETCFFVGNVFLENPLGGSKTISSAGGGSIVWTTGSVTFSNASTTFDVGIQDVSAASSPAQGDGTFDVKASFTGGGGGVTGTAVQASVMTSGTKTLAHGDKIAIGFVMTARGGADSVDVKAAIGGQLGSDINWPLMTDNTGGSYARKTTSYPNVYIVFDDGTIGWLFGSAFVNSASSIAFNSGSATADEYGNFCYLPATFNAHGVFCLISFSSNAADCEIILYSNPLGTPVAERTITVDATQIGGTGTGISIIMPFSSPYNMKAYTPYVVAVRPTTATNLTCYYIDPASANAAKTNAVGANFYAVRRLDNTGAFSDYNGGTAKTRLMNMRLLGYSIEQGINNCNYQLGL